MQTGSSTSNLHHFLILVTLLNMEKIDRTLKNEALEMAKAYPVVTIIGPRQSGKTTLVRSLFPNKPYVTLENPDDRDFAKEDPKGFFEKYPNGAIFDELQRLPILLSYIQGIVDEQNKNDPNYENMSPKYYKSIAFKAACELIFHGKSQPSGYTEPLLHLNRIIKKN